MRLVKCFALSAVVFGILSVHVHAATPVTNLPTRAVYTDPADKPVSDPAAMSDACPATDLGTLAASGGSWMGDTTGLANDFEDDYPSGCSYSSGGGSGADEIFRFQVDSDGVWDFDTCTVPAGWDTSLGLRVDTAGCPGDAVECDGDGCNVGGYESGLSVFLNAGVDYYMVVDGWVAGTEGPFTVTYIQSLAACTSDAACSDGDPCNGEETCNTSNGQCEDGTPPCLRSQTCVDLGGGATECIDPDGCIIYENIPPGLGAWFIADAGFLDADDWVFAPGNLGRNLQDYTVITVGLNDYGVATTLWPHGPNCVGGSSTAECGSQGGECDTDADCTGGLCVGGALGCTFWGGDGAPCTTDADCPGNCDITTATLCVVDGDCPLGEVCVDQGTCPGDGTCQLLGFTVDNTFPAHGPPAGPGAIPDTLCVFSGLPAGYFVALTCLPTGPVVMPNEGVYATLSFIAAAGGQQGPALADQLAQIGDSHLRFYEDQGAGGLDWTRFYFPSLGLGGQFVGQMCTEPLGACCTPDVSAGAACSIVTEADCTTGGGTYIGDNNAVHEFDCSADGDGDGTPDACDPCPLDDPDDTDGDGVCDSDDPCPLDNPDDTDGDGSCDSDDPCPLDPDDDADGDGFCCDQEVCCADPFKQDPGQCGCGIPDTDNDGDGTANCNDDCPDDPNKTDPGICGCGVGDQDSDGDGVADCNDQCPGVDDAVFAPGCVGAIPTVSEWGLVVLALLLLAAGKVYFGRRKAMA